MHRQWRPPHAAAARFYAARQNGPMWFRPGSNGEAAAQLASILRRAQLDGLANGPELASQVEAALVQARTGDKAKMAAAERADFRGLGALRSEGQRADEGHDLR